MSNFTDQMMFLRNLSSGVLASIMLLASCAKEKADQPNVLPNSIFQVSDRAPVTITPSGDVSGVTDANALEAALNTPGVKSVRLGAGTFYLNRPVVASGFAGTFKGAGTASTFVAGVGSSAVPFQTASLHIPLETDQFPASVFFYFPDPSGTLTVSDFSMSIPNGFMAGTGFEGTQNLSAFIAVKLGALVPDVTLRNLSMTGADALPGSPGWYLNQPIFAAYVLGDRDAADFPQPSNAGGKIKFQMSQIAKTAAQALVLEGFKNADLTVDGNTFSETKQINIRFLDGCNVKVQDNAFNTSSWGSLVITQEHALGFGPITGEVTNVLVQNNSIVSNGFLGIEIGAIPDPGAAPFDILVSGNTITKGPDPAGVPNMAAIGIYEGHEGAIVRQNTLLGEANYGVYLIDVDGSAVSLNATAGFNAFIAHYGLTGASDNNQITVADPSTAIDEGSGNVFTGPVTIL